MLGVVIFHTEEAKTSWMSFFHLGFHFSMTSLKDVQFLWQNKVSWLFSTSLKVFPWPFPSLWSPWKTYAICTSKFFRMTKCREPVGRVQFAVSKITTAYKLNKKEDNSENIWGTDPETVNKAITRFICSYTSRRLLQSAILKASSKLPS